MEVQNKHSPGDLMFFCPDLHSKKVTSLNPPSGDFEKSSCEPMLLQWHLVNLLGHHPPPWSDHDAWYNFVTCPSGESCLRFAQIEIINHLRKFLSKFRSTHLSKIYPKILCSTATSQNFTKKVESSYPPFSTKGTRSTHQRPPQSMDTRDTSCDVQGSVTSLHRSEHVAQLLDISPKLTALKKHPPALHLFAVKYSIEWL